MYEPFTRREKVHILWMAFHLWNSLLIGNAPASSFDTYKRMRNPQPGDWVVELSTMTRLLMRPDDERQDLWDGQVVRFVRTQERYHVSLDPSTSGDATAYAQTWSEQELVCENPDGTEFTWTNANLIAIPIEERFYPRI